MLELSDGTEHRLPPDLRAFREAKPGTYWLRSTDEKVADPDYIATYTVEKPGRA